LPDKKKGGVKMMTDTDRKVYEVLLVEDNPADARLISEAFKGFRILSNLSLVRDGEMAIEYLRRQNDFAAAAKPDIIILDLNVPKKNGFEILAEIRKDEGLKRIPIIVLSNSDAELDIQKSYELSANCYITKPASLDDFIDTIMSIENFWLSTVKLPRA
jgi:two-component system, chemotaxis family, response regulator Rcp1